MKTTRTAALEEIVGAIKKVAANADAVLKLAVAYSVVKRGVILPDWIKDEEAQP